MPNIKYRISLEGGEQVGKELLTVEQAIKRLQDAAKSGTGADTFASTTAAISKLGSTAQEALGAAAAAAKKFGVSASELAGVETVIKALAARSKDSSTAFATLAQNYDKARASASSAGQAMAGQAAVHETLATSTAKVGTASQKAAEGFRLLGGQVRTVGAALAQAGVPIGGVAASLTSVGAAATRAGPVVGTIAVGVAAISAGAIATTAALARFAESALKTVEALSKLSEKGDSSFEFVSSMQQAFARGGVSLDEFAKSYENLRQTLAVARPTAFNDLAASADNAAQATQSVKEASLQLAEAQAKVAAKGRPFSQQLQQRFQRERESIALEKAHLQLAEARRAEAVADANNLDTLAKKYENLSKGIQQNFDPLTTLESKAKALTDMLASGSQMMGPYGTRLKEVGSVAEQDAKKFLKLADVFHNISDEAERMQLGKQMGLSPEFVRRLSLGSEALSRIQNDVKSLGLALNNVDQQSVQKFKEGQAGLGSTLDALKDKMGALAAPAFTSFFEGLTGRIKELSPEFQNLARSFGQLDFTALGQVVGNAALSFARFGVVLGQALQSAGKGDLGGLTSLIADMGATLVQAMALLGKAAGEALLNSLKEALTPKGGFSVQGLLDAIKADFAKFEASLVQNANTLAEKIKRGLQGGFVSPAGAAEAGGGQLGGADFGPMIAGAEVAAVRIKAIFANALSQSAGAMDFSASIAAAQTAAMEIGMAFANINIAGVLGGQIDILIAKFNALAIAAAAAASAAASAASNGGGGGGAPAPFARGGLFGGRGSGTSDSNLAWISRGEHIMPARAVAQPGVLAFLEALRRSGGNLRGILDDMGHFARGGMVLRAIPAFATGGLAGGMSNVTIQFPGLPPIGGLRASSDVVDQLHKAAALAQVRSGGRKPSRYS